MPRIETISIPGRNGDVQIWDGSYQNRTVKAECYLLDHAAVRKIDVINSWLISEPGYFRFEDTCDPRHFMLARVVSGIPRNVKAGMLNSFEIVFDVMPARYLKSGEKPIKIYESGYYNPDLFNPTQYAASPILKAHGTLSEEAGTVNIYRAVFPEGTFEYRALLYDMTVYYDTANDRAYSAYGASFDHMVTAVGELKIPPGNSQVRWIAPITDMGSLWLTPRWWEL